MLEPSRPVHPFLYILVGLLIGGGISFFVFWGFPTNESLLESHTISDRDATDRGDFDFIDRENAQFGVELGAVAPDFVLEDIAGEEYRLSELRGKVVLLNFWATWCGPCLIEMPLLESESQAYKEQGFLVLAVNDGESLDKVNAFGEQNGLNFPLLLDSGSFVQRLYEIRGYPSSVFIDEQGRVKFIHIGLIQERQLAEYMQELGFGS